MISNLSSKTVEGAEPLVQPEQRLLVGLEQRERGRSVTDPHGREIRHPRALLANAGELLLLLRRERPLGLTGLQLAPAPLEQPRRPALAAVLADDAGPELEVLGGKA